MEKGKPPGCDPLPFSFSYYLKKLNSDLKKKKNLTHINSIFSQISYHFNEIVLHSIVTVYKDWNWYSLVG